MLNYNELKPGTYIVFEGKPYVVLEYSFLRMQQRKPAVQTKIKDLISGKVISRSFHPQDTIEEADISKKKVKFLYSNCSARNTSRSDAGGGEFWFCDENDPGARFKLPQEIIGDSADLMKPNTIVDALVFGEKIINIDLPIKVDLKVTEAPPSFRGDTASGGSKQVKLETGATVNVPFFINQGDVVRVNTRERAYVERVFKA
jgi:elongation factor P